MSEGQKRSERFVLQGSNPIALAKVSAEATKVAFAHTAREAATQGGYCRTWSVGFHAETIRTNEISKRITSADRDAFNTPTPLPVRGVSFYAFRARNARVCDARRGGRARLGDNSDANEGVKAVGRI